MAHSNSSQLSPPIQLVRLLPAKAAPFLLFFLTFLKTRDWFYYYSSGVAAMAKVWREGKRGFWNLALCLGVGVALLSLTLNMVILSRFLFTYKGADGSSFWGVLVRSSSCSRVGGGGEEVCLEKEMGEASYYGATCDSSICLRSSASVINLDHGDPTMFESFWKRMGEKSSITIPGWQTMSYFSDVNNICWFLEPQFAEEIRRLHRLVGNARTDDRHIIVGTGSTQLFQAALYALSPPDALEPVSVVSAIPYYSSYPSVTDFLQSRLYRWAGDAHAFQGDSHYIELVCSPNNPDGFSKQAILNSGNGSTIHDLAYYWPQYTAITSSADHKIMLFTVSKSTGHAGTRIGWALVKDEEVAKRMTKFIELNTIGVSKDSQLRAAKIIGAITNGYESPNSNEVERFFDYGRRLMTKRWDRLRQVVRSTGIFSLPEFTSEYCNFDGMTTESHPAFAWLRCEREDIEDCESFLRTQKILTRGGKHFGVDPKYVRVSMLDRDDTFDLFIARLLSMS